MKLQSAKSRASRRRARRKAKTAAMRDWVRRNASPIAHHSRIVAQTLSANVRVKPLSAHSQAARRSSELLLVGEIRQAAIIYLRLSGQWVEEGKPYPFRDKRNERKAQPSAHHAQSKPILTEEEYEAQYGDTPTFAEMSDVAAEARR